MSRPEEKKEGQGDGWTLCSGDSFCWSHRQVAQEDTVLWVGLGTNREPGPLHTVPCVYPSPSPGSIHTSP